MREEEEERAREDRPKPHTPSLSRRLLSFSHLLRGSPRRCILVAVTRGVHAPETQQVRQDRRGAGVYQSGPVGAATCNLPCTHTCRSPAAFARFISCFSCHSRVAHMLRHHSWARNRRLRRDSSPGALSASPMPFGPSGAFCSLTPLLALSPAPPPSLPPIPATMAPRRSKLPLVRDTREEKRGGGGKEGRGGPSWRAQKREHQPPRLTSLALLHTTHSGRRPLRRPPLARRPRPSRRRW